MKVLVIGSGGREHVLVWKLKQSPRVEKIFCAPGNAGTASISENLAIKVDDFAALADFAERENIGMTVVGPEVPLANGIVDYFNERKLNIFGPDKKAAQLEGSKVFSKNFMKKYGIPSAAYSVFSNYAEAEKFLDTLPADRQIVVKADGLAAGKGVIICPDTSSAKENVKQILEGKVFGAAGKDVVVEEFLTGEEASLQLFLDGDHYSLMAAAQDHKRVGEGDQGLNTGGMGAYAPAPIVDASLTEKIEKTIVMPIIKGLKSDGINYKGILYIGLMICDGEPSVLEFNCRFGDPETQVVLPLLKTDLLEIIEKVNNNELDKIKIEWYNKTALCVVLASGGYPGEFSKGKEIKGIETASALDNLLVFHAGTESANLAGNKLSVVTSGGRVLGVTGLGEDIEEAINAAYDGVSKISFEGMHFRKDIGYRARKRVNKI